MIPRPDLMRSVFPVMGTVASIVVSADDVVRLGETHVSGALSAARAQLEGLDHRFSHYSPESQISTWLAGGSVSPDTVAEFTFVLRQCGRLRDESNGVFTIKNPATGTIDTAGYVKGYAIGRAADVLLGRGLSNFIVTVGGDTFCAGRSSDERPWRVAVVTRMRSRAIAAIVDATDLAVGHVRNRRAGQPHLERDSHAPPRRCCPSRLSAPTSPRPTRTPRSRSPWARQGSGGWRVTTAIARSRSEPMGPCSVTPH